MWQAIRNCICCLQHKGALPKPPLHHIMAIIPLDLLHVDFTSIETTLEQSPRVANVLVFQDHFMKHVLPYVTPDQTAKNIAKFLFQGYISVFGALARLLSNRGANIMGSVIEEMCKILGIKKLQTMPCHPQTNGLMGRLYQVIMWMIGKLREDRKANWPSHLAEIVHAYNATHSAVMGYSPHYLMFRQRPRLLVNFYFPHWQHQGPHEIGLCQVCGQIHSFHSRQIEDQPMGGTSPINGRSVLTKMVLWQKNRHCEPEAWQPGTSESRCF